MPHTTTTEIPLREALGLVDDPSLIVNTSTDDVGLAIEVTVDGDTIDPAWTTATKECEHGNTLNLNTLVAVIRNDGGNVVGHQSRVRARCSDCGLRFGAKLEGTFPRDGIAGIVITWEPIPDD
jgi:hypothetical protein